MRTIAVFDFLSHAAMHLPFNEGYLRVLRAAFPSDHIIFHAQPDHIAALAPRLQDIERLSLRPIAPFKVPFGLSRHNPIGGSLAARACISAIRTSLHGISLRLSAVLGADANLHEALRRSWPGITSAMLHIVLHNHVAAAVSWRSRNPLLRRFDLQARLQNKLPRNVRLLALELGIAEAIEELAPAMSESVDTLEHPILESEWYRNDTTRTGELRIAFVGHCSADKGFGAFAAWAKRYAGPELSFYAVGLAARETSEMDLSGLARLPSKTHVPRDEYVSVLASCDVVCLPLGALYAYVASGSVIDAIAALKPLFCLENASLLRMSAKYGPFGMLAPDMAALESYVAGLTRAAFMQAAEKWAESLTQLREARRPAVLGETYRLLVNNA